MEILEIPPPHALHESREDVPYREHRIIIDFYKTEKGYAVWPCISGIRGSLSGVKHFPQFGPFPSKDAARESTRKKGQSLIDSGFDVFSS